MEISDKALSDIRYALAVAYEVLTKYRLASTDQNPKGVTDLVWNALFLVENICKGKGK